MPSDKAERFERRKRERQRERDRLDKSAVYDWLVSCRDWHEEHIPGEPTPGVALLDHMITAFCKEFEFEPEARDERRGDELA